MQVRIFGISVVDPSLSWVCPEGAHIPRGKIMQNNLLSLGGTWAPLCWTVLDWISNLLFIGLHIFKFQLQRFKNDLFLIRKV